MHFAGVVTLSFFWRLLAIKGKGLPQNVWEHKAQLRLDKRDRPSRRLVTRRGQMGIRYAGVPVERRRPESSSRHDNSFSYWARLSLGITMSFYTRLARRFRLRSPSDAGVKCSSPGRVGWLPNGPAHGFTVAG